MYVKKPTEKRKLIKVYFLVTYTKTKYIAKKKNRNLLEAYSETLSSIQDGAFCENSRRLSTVNYFQK